MNKPLLTQELLDLIKNKLDTRERSIIELRLGIGVSKPQTLNEIGISLNLTRERIRQIQNAALRKIGSPELNSFILTSELSNSNDIATKRFKRKVKERVEKKYGHLKQDQQLVSIWLTSPFTSNNDATKSKKHSLPATWARVNGERTIFLDDEGTIIADWPTEIVDFVQWPEEPRIKATKESHNQRMEKIKERYPRAWSAWDESEDLSLVNEFQAKISFDQMCENHERAPGGINSRLKKLLLIPDKQYISETRKQLG